MATNSDHFGWLVDEIAIIKSRRFHVFEVVGSNCLTYEFEGRAAILKSDFPEFMCRFGIAKLFMDHGDAPSLSVYPLDSQRRERFDDARWYVGFGFSGHQSVYFDESSLFQKGSSNVFVAKGHKIHTTGENFRDWLQDAYFAQRNRYSRRRWKVICEGLPPFSASDESIVEERRKFHWRLMGMAENGNAILEIRNLSSVRLPYLTIGAQGAGGEILRGAIWVDVSNIAPGEVGLVEKDCYKDQIPFGRLELFDMPDPIPEKRDAYWEFGPPR